MITRKRKERLILQLLRLKESWSEISKDWHDDWMNDEYPFEGCFMEMNQDVDTWVDNSVRNLKRDNVTVTDFEESRMCFYSIDQFNDHFQGQDLDDEEPDERPVEKVFGYLAGYYIIKYKNRTKPYEVLIGNQVSDYLTLDDAQNDLWSNFVKHEENL